jgi:acetolactate synthase small subunit
MAAHHGVELADDRGQDIESFSSGTTTETKMSRLIRPSVMAQGEVIVRRGQRLIEVVDVVDLAAQMEMTFGADGSRLNRIGRLSLTRSAAGSS